MARTRTDAERGRLRAADEDGVGWRDWGPYLAERAWGTVREDYSATGEAWDSFPHDHARSRTYRWNEDGMAGFCDAQQTWCLALALWNGVDPILKERMFGLAGPEGNHGEDAKDLWWYTDGTPTHSWMSWRHHLPQRPFPYDELVRVNGERGRGDPEHELLDTGVFDGDRFWVVEVDHAKAGAHDLCTRIRVTNAGPDEATIHVLPTLWFRNTWAWGLPGAGPAPQLHPRDDGGVRTAGLPGGDLELVGEGEALFCDNETNTRRLFGVEGPSDCPKDGIGDHVVHGADTVRRGGPGTKAALHSVLTVPAGETRELRLRLVRAGEPADLGRGWTDVVTRRAAEADTFHAALAPAASGEEERLVLRQAVAGLLWSKQFFHYDVARWLDGDPAGPPPPPERHDGRNRAWRHLNNADVLAVPDPWEYPWYATWDLAFHAVTLALVDPAFAKEQLLLLTREWYLHPNGQLPAYEWAFDDVNPPVHAWAALRVFELDGGRDHAFLARVLHKLLLNVTWWVNRKDAEGNDLFGGGFLGLDNVGPVDRSAMLPDGGRLEQSDGTAWMAMYCLDLWEMALELAKQDPVYEDLATKFFEHFARIASAAQRLWSDEDGFFYDVLMRGDGSRTELRVRSVVGLLPLAATSTLGAATSAQLPSFDGAVRWFLGHEPGLARVVSAVHTVAGAEGRLLSVCDEAQLRRLLAVMLDPAEFLSDHGLRSVSAAHRDAPFALEVGGGAATVGYEPGESNSGLFGGNSNWRGPVWFPVNVLLIDALRRFASFYGDDLTVEHPVGSGRLRTLSAVADDLADRLVSLFLPGPDGSRPADGGRTIYRDDARWQGLLTFSEYFHGDTGAGLGASHQTGWTALVANLLVERGRR